MGLSAFSASKLESKMEIGFETVLYRQLQGITGSVPARQ